ncbi:MAG: M17 family peptidase N-terminal domain-containing protein, partial [Bdellovibrionota bacterium]
MAASLNHSLDLDGDHALFSGEVTGLVAVVCANERPLSGLAGKLDWLLAGQISNYIRAGLITGNEGECVFLPFTKSDKTYHLILVGGGYSESMGDRKELKGETIRALHKNLMSLRPPKIGISRSDFGGVTNEYFNTKLKG